MTLEHFNNIGFTEAQAELFKCCGSTRWAQMLCAQRPFASVADLKEKSDAEWNRSSEADAMEAFSHHPKIGAKSLEEKFASTKQWASGEQAGVQTASAEVLAALLQGNIDYEQKFGFIFIVCATGKTASEMLELLLQRLPNNRADELLIAMGEQNKITHIRIDKLFA